MEKLYADIAARTGGNIYIGVVGPVRTGKSTLIKRIMEELVIPNIEDPYRAERARDELPQSGSGKTIMTSEPKFIPEEAVEISPDGTSKLHIRMIDSVGYMVEGAVGAEEDGKPRMVTTPWFDHEIPMTEAAELGTKKVMEEHCSIGIVVTTDGTITDIPRADYQTAERKAILDMKATGKPFLVIVNSRQCDGDPAKTLKEKLIQEYDVNVMVADCQVLTSDDIKQLIAKLLYAFPVEQLYIYMPKWIDTLESAHPVKSALYNKLRDTLQCMTTISQAEKVISGLTELEQVVGCSIRNIDHATGTVCYDILLPEQLFYEIISSRAGIAIESDVQLLQLLTELSAIRKEYQKVSDALQAVKATGYGVVMPAADELKMEPPEILRKSGAYGVKLKAGAPSIHMIRVDVDTEISPMVGDEKQSQDLISYLSAETPEKLWESNMFGKSVYSMIQEGLTAKLIRMPDEVRQKFRGTLSKIVNEGASGLFCLII